MVNTAKCSQWSSVYSGLTVLASHHACESLRPGRTGFTDPNEIADPALQGQATHSHSTVSRAPELSSPPENAKWLKARPPCLHFIHETTLASNPNFPCSLMWTRFFLKIHLCWMHILFPIPFFQSQQFDTLWHASLTLPFPLLTHMCSSSWHFWPISHCAPISK